MLLYSVYKYMYIYIYIYIYNIFDVDMYIYVFLYQYIIYNNFSFERIEEPKVLEGIIDTNNIKNCN